MKKNRLPPDIFYSIQNKNQEDNGIQKLYSKQNSIIKKLFFFELELINNCNNKECEKSEIYSYTYNSFLNIDFNQIDKDIKENKIAKLDIDDLIDYTLNKSYNNICKECLKENVTIKKKFYSFPQYLIVCTNKKKNIIFFNKEFLSNRIIKYKYILISFIIDDKKFFCKSPDNNCWYKYEVSKKPEKIEFEEFFETIPYLLIYKKI